MTEHTPGPWQVGARTDALWPVHQGATYIADAYREADARLIAAAPDLARLLRLYVVDHGNPIDGDCGCPWCEEATAIFAAMTGRGEVQP